MLYETILQAPLWDQKRWPNFKPHEFACKCGGRFCQGEFWYDETFFDALQALREDVGKSIWITSGHRCNLWNAAVGGAPMSMHKQIAVDVSLGNHPDRWTLLAKARRHGFNGIGKGRTFLHLDRRTVPATWDYGPRSIEAWKTG